MKEVVCHEQMLAEKTAEIFPKIGLRHPTLQQAGRKR